MKQYLLFDLDRTLWDFDGNADRTYRAMFEEFDIQSLCHADYETFHERYKVINDVLWESYRNGTLTKELLAIRRFSYTLAAFGCDADSPEIIRLSNRMSDYYVEEGTRQTGLMPGAREVLDWLDTQRDHFVMAVITNGFSEAQLPKMKTAGIDRYFDYFFLSEDLGYMKPDRRFFDAAIAKMGARPEQCLVIGDDYKVDILGAMNAGIPQIWYNPGGVTLPEYSAQPTYEIRKLEEMKEMLPSGAQASSLHIQLETMQEKSNSRVKNLDVQKQHRRDLRKKGTAAEAVLWSMIRARKIEGLQFRRQYSVENSILDFYCPSLKLAIELDGDYHYHDDMYEQDYLRDKTLWEKYSIKTLRYENRIVFECPRFIFEDIIKEKERQERGEHTPPSFGHPL